MFYMKCKNHILEIRQDNVYTRCPGCRKEMHVDLHDILNDGDLEGTQVFCEKCTYKRAMEHRGEPWAEKVLRQRNGKI